MKKFERYTPDIEAKMKLHFSQLGEKNKRLYAAVEAERLGYGGRRYISKLFNISEYRIRAGIKELNNPDLLSEIPKGKQRRKGGGRKKKEEAITPE